MNLPLYDRGRDFVKMNLNNTIIMTVIVIIHNGSNSIVMFDASARCTRQYHNNPNNIIIIIMIHFKRKFKTHTRCAACGAPHVKRQAHPKGVSKLQQCVCQAHPEGCFGVATSKRNRTRTASSLSHLYLRSLV